jgi:hypothetical protein
MHATSESWAQTVTNYQSCIETERGASEGARYTIVESEEAPDSVGQSLGAVLRDRLADEPLTHWRVSEPDDSDTTTVGYVTMAIGGGATGLSGIFALVALLLPSRGSPTVPDWVLITGASSLGVLAIGVAFTLISTWAYGDSTPHRLTLRGAARCP